MKATVYVDQETKTAIGEMPSRMSASKLFRWLMRLMNTNDMEWKKLIAEDEEIREVQDYIRPKLRKALGLKPDRIGLHRDDD